MQPVVQPFFDTVTCTVTYVVFLSGHPECVVIDPVLDYDPKAGRTSTATADKVIEFVSQRRLCGRIGFWKRTRMRTTTCYPP
jgi:glyoxylase-like metal-dependent hydrolase (beta-lactamase superfamily II)